MLSLSTHAQTNSVTVAVASNFADPLKALKTQFEQQHSNIRLNIVIGSSGKLFAQIQHGAPFDVFMSADQTKPSLLTTNGVAVKDSQYTYAQGALVLWSNQSTPITENTLSLFEGKLAIANPKIAPYGEAAIEVLNHYNNKKIQLINANNIIGAAQYVFSESVEMGLVAHSSVLQQNDPSINSWLVDDSLYSPILQDLVLLTDSTNTQLFLSFLKSKQAKATMAQYGYKGEL